MTLDAGNPTATQGLANEIYELLEQHLRPLVDTASGDDPPTLEQAWQRLSFSIASGIVEHVTDAAETVASPAQDPAFWNWLSAFASTFRTWASSGGDVVQLRTALDDFFAAHPATPDDLRGIVE